MSTSQNVECQNVNNLAEVNITDLEQTLLSIEAHVHDTCTYRESRPRRPSSVVMHKVHVRHGSTCIYIRT